MSKSKDVDATLLQPIVPRPSCGKCGATGVKIYREYGSFRRPETDRCNECIDQGHKGWMVPCVLDADGDAWGYTSVPKDACDAFYALPEKSDSFPHWRRIGGWSDSDFVAPCRAPDHA